jgi:hypothetical protein
LDGHQFSSDDGEVSTPGWSRRPKVLDDLVGDAEALKFIVDHLLVTGA